MVCLLRACVLGVIVASAALGRTARAEEEVRIAIVSKSGEIAIGGRALAIYDVDVGDRLFAADEGSVSVVATKGAIEVRDGKGKPIGRGRRVLVEANAGVRVGRGVYLGRVEIHLENGGKLLAINRLPLETYLLGIVGSEMSPEWPIEALKAQAVAARTYAMQRHMMMRAANKPYDLESTVISQVYKGAEKIRPSVIRAVKETRGEVLAYKHALVEALFHSTCGGRTRSARAAFGKEVAYLTPRPCEWCRDSTLHKWRLEIPVQQLSKLLESAKLARGGVEALERDAGDRAVAVREKKTSRELSPRAVREAIGYMKLYSEDFTAKTHNRKVEFSGRGFGHGVGMCQWGARGMARAGKNHRQILEHYYGGVRVVRIY